MLYIVATPIGNLKDITFRAIEILQSVDGIICEDTRRTSILLNHYQIPFGHPHESSPRVEAGGDPLKKPLLVLNDFNEGAEVPYIIDLLKTDQNLALVSDAGTPLISDPGYKLIRECIAEGIEIDSLPGPVSPIVALTLSGLPPDKFMFLGYPPEKPGHRLSWFKQLSHLGGDTRSHLGNFEVTYIIFISPHKLIRNLEEMKEIYGDIEIVLAHELTKIHQSVDKKPISEFLKTLKAPKGEYILLFRI